MSATQVDIGDTFGKWTVLRLWRDLRTGKRVARVRCQCGRQAKRPIEWLIYESGSRACVSCAKLTHGMTGTPEYVAWRAMKSRCQRPNDISHPNYGGRGIAVCDRWNHSFENFLRDMGMRPSPAHSLDRYPNPDGDYEAGNCRWATREQQAQNRRPSLLITYRGERRAIREWERIIHFPRGGIQRRLRRGWTRQRALETPRACKHRRA